MQKKYAAIVMLTISFLGISTAYAALVPGGVAGPVVSAGLGRGFPAWYADQNGLALDLMEAADGFGISDPVDLENPLSVETGFNTEAFWWATEALVDTQLPDGTTGRGLIVLAMEAAYLNETPADGDQMSFGRTRFFIDVPQAGRYTIKYPFGTAVFDVSEERMVATGGIRAINSHRLAESGFRPDLSINSALGDVGCEAGPCDFNLALESGIGPFLTWDTFNTDPDLSDPALSNPANPERRYVGNPLIEHKIKGSPVNQNFFEITGPAGVIAQTNLFTVVGRISQGQNPPPPPPEDPVLTTIVVSPDTASISLGKTLQFTAQGFDQFGNPMPSNITWKIDNRLMGTISATGLFRPFRSGSAVVTATSGSITETVNVTILGRPVLTSITISPVSATVAKGATQQFTATGFDQFGNPMEAQIVWRSSNPRLGTINARTGLFTAKNAGTLNVTASFGRVKTSATIIVP